LNSKLDQKKLQEAQQKLNYTPITPYTPGATQTTYHYSGMEDLGESVFDSDSYTLGDIEQRNF
jgi:hypothetical protein